jgi:Domain of unknown function (DUF4232)
VRRAAPLAAAGLVAVVLAGCGGTTTVTVTVTRTRTVTTTAVATTPSAASRPCTGSDLQGTFAVLRGSAGAGQISYVLTVTNSSTRDCFVSGIPGVQLLDASGAPLPTHVSAAHPGQATAAKITLAPGDSASAEARFSPDVPGVGENQQGRCEPKAVTMRVSTIGPATVSVPISPPTSVCEQGSLRFDLFASGR